MADDDLVNRARSTADALEAKAASVADDLKGVAIETATRLQEVMRNLAGQMIVLAQEMKKLSHAGRRNRRLIRLLGVSVFLDVLLSLGLGVLFVRENSTAARTDDIVSARTEARAATCRSDNTFIGFHNALVDALQTSIELANVPNPSRTAEQQHAADLFFSEYKATIEQARVPARDCSPVAIEQFYKNKGK